MSLQPALFGLLCKEKESEMKKFFGNKAFYKMLLLIAIPMIVQNGITNLVNMLDNMMVGQLGTELMSGVAISNQLIFVFNLTIFGAVAGAGIFGAQFHGSGNTEGVRNTFRFKIVICMIVAVIFIGIFIIFDSQLISLYLHQSDDGSNLALTLAEGRKYLRIMLIGLLPFALNTAYVGTLRETGETVLPMKAGITAVLVNLVFNWLLIFGNLGFPKLGVEGAALATVLSRFVETAIVVSWTHRHKEKNKVAVGVYKGFSIPKDLVAKIIIRGWPLLLNEFLFSVGMTMLTQCYSMRGLSVMAAFNISSTLTNLFRIVMFASGNTVAIIIGNLLGAGKMEEAHDTNTKLITAAVLLHVIIGLILFAIAPLFPRLYNTTNDVRAIAASFLMVAAWSLPIKAFNNCCYFTLRAGGKAFITFLFDSVFIWVVLIPPVYCLARFTSVTAPQMFAIVQALELIKAIFGFTLVKKGTWLNNLV